MRRRRELMRQPAASAHRTPRQARNCLHGRPDLLRHKKTACVRSHGNQSARRAPSASPACSDASPRRRVTCARRRRRAIRSCVWWPAAVGAVLPGTFAFSPFVTRVASSYCPITRIRQQAVARRLSSSATARRRCPSLKFHDGGGGRKSKRRFRRHGLRCSMP